MYAKGTASKENIEQKPETISKLNKYSTFKMKLFKLEFSIRAKNGMNGTKIALKGKGAFTKPE